MFKLFCIVTLCLTAVYARVKLELNDCGSEHATIQSVYVEECEAEPCIVEKGLDYTITVEFTALDDVTEAHNVLLGGLGVLEVPFPLEPEDACESSVTCPMVAGESYTYSQVMTCPSYAPSVEVTAIWAVKDENDENIFCFETELSIADDEEK